MKMVKTTLAGVAIAAALGAAALAETAPTGTPAPAPAAAPAAADAAKTANANAAAAAQGQAAATSDQQKAAAAAGEVSAAKPPPKPISPRAMGVTLIVLGVLAALAFMLLVRALAASKWSLNDAISEEITVTLFDADGAPVKDAQGAPQQVTKLGASTSRLIALMGLFAILLLYLGFGAVVLYYFGTGQGAAPGLMDATKFLLSGMTLFAPYVVNKFASVFQLPTAK
jgi:hypothetical protein